MNINKVRKHYNKLTTEERFAAIVAAAYRGDDQEVKALLSSTPRVLFSAADTTGLSFTFKYTVMYYLLVQLSLASYILMTYLKLSGRKWDTETESKIYFYSQLYLTQAEAWEQICTEYGIKPEHIKEDLPGVDILPIVSEMAQSLVESEDEVISAVKILFGNKAELGSVDDFKAEWRNLIDDLIGIWD